MTHLPCALDLGLADVALRPFGEHVWPIADAALHLLADVVRDRHADQPEVCAWLAALLIERVSFNIGLALPDQTAGALSDADAWAKSRIGFSVGGERDMSCAGDARALAAIELLAEWVYALPKFGFDESEHVGVVVRAMVGVAVTSAARATDGRTASAVPGWLIQLAASWYDTFLP